MMSGWLNHDDFDPEFAGYAMWATSPPFESDFDAFQNGTPPRVATAIEQRLVELGTDFEGLMKAARYAIGAVLIHRDDVPLWDFCPTPFEFHEISALVTLSMASDRVRDLLVVAVLDEPLRPGHELDQYRLALSTARQYGREADVEPLESLTPEIVKLKKRRNEVVHKMAMKAARVQREMIERDRRGAKRRRRLLDWSPAQTPSPEQEMAVHMKELNERVAALRSAYETVIKSGDLVFRIEHDTRARRRTA